MSAGPSYDVGVCWEQVVRLDRTYAAPARRGGGLFALHDWPVLLDLAVWRDLDPETAGERAKARNLLQGDSREDLDLWDSRWVPEGQEYQRAVRPEQLAHLVMAAGGRD